MKNDVQLAKVSDKDTYFVSLSVQAVCRTYHKENLGGGGYDGDGGGDWMYTLPFP